MKGKKIDSEFISEFISKSIENGLNTPDLIVESAKNKVNNIDVQIKEIEQQKIFRSKLLDVINNFDKYNKVSKLENAKILLFYKLKYPETCKKIYYILKNKSKDLQDINRVNFKDIEEYKFCIKQMIEIKVIARIGDSMIKGERFDEYSNFLLKDC